MSGQIQNMKDAIKGEGGGLQSTSAIVGETMAENSDTRSSQSKKVDEASSSLGQFSKGASGNTTSGTNVSASDQIENMQTGQADHLSLGPDLTKKS